MSDEAAASETLSFVNVPSQAPTIFADSCIFATGLAEVARLQFVEAVPGAIDSIDPGMKMRYVANLLMPESNLPSMLKYILRNLPEQVRKDIINGL